MPYKMHRSVFKRMRQNARRREMNRVVRGSMRAVLRAIRTKRSLDDVLERLTWKISTDDKGELMKRVNARMYSIVDKALKKGVIHRNKAARHKMQIAKWINHLSA